MAQRSARSSALSVTLLGLICAWVLSDVCSGTFDAFLAPSSSQSSFGTSFGHRQAGRSLASPRKVATVVLEKEQATTSQVPSIGTIAMQGLAFLGAITGGAWAFAGAKVGLQTLVGVAGLYVIMSVNEYVVHRYYQHVWINKTTWYRKFRSWFGLPTLKSSGHVEHHKETLDDMTLDQKPDPILDSDPYRGTAFSWTVSAKMTLEIALQSYPFLYLCGWSLTASTVALFVALGLHAAVWQTLHPAMHELPDPTLSYGVPGWSLKWLRSTRYFRFLYANHEGHHRVPGAHGNYNVCCPLADHLFGTYVGIVPPKQPATA